MVSWKAGSRQGRPARDTLRLFGASVAENGVQKVPFWKWMKIENGTKIKLFVKVQHLDRLKTVPGSGFEQTWKFDAKSIAKSMVSDGPKPLKSIEKQTFCLILGHSQKRLKNYAKGDLTSHVFLCKMATWASQLRLILWFLKFWCDAKNHHFWMPSRRSSKNHRIGTQIAERTPERPEDSTGVPVFGSRVPRPSTRATKQQGS